MFCPQCRVEYRHGFVHCTDCDVDLVDALPDEGHSSNGGSPAEGDLSEANLEKVWEGENQEACVSTCRGLQEASIPYLVRERDWQVLYGKEQKFVILVSSSNSKAAREIANRGTLDFTDSEEDQAVMEIPARDDLPVQEVHGDWNPSNWFPEDATAEVWSGNQKDWSFTIEMSLKENRINYRTESRGSDPTRIFVLPEDEARARVIVLD